VVVLALPNPIEGVCARLLSRAEITALVAARVSKTYQRSWNGVADKRAVVVGRTGSGGLGAIPSAGIDTMGLEVRCYGSNPAEAMEVWRIVDPILSPEWRSSGGGFDIRNAWVAGGLRCYGIERVSRAQDATDPERSIPFILCFYSIAYAETAVP
jgi:hypothetical protein